MQTEELKIKDGSQRFSDRKIVYIVDENESMRQTLKQLMVSQGFAVNVYSSSEDFFNAVPSSIQGCLILNINMRGLDAWAILQRLYTSKNKQPVIVMTEDKSDRLKERALKMGAIGFLQKPFNDQELIDLINQL